MSDGRRLAFRTVCDGGSDAGCCSCCSRPLCSSLVLSRACVLSWVEIFWGEYEDFGFFVGAIAHIKMSGCAS